MGGGASNAAIRRASSKTWRSWDFFGVMRCSRRSLEMRSSSSRSLAEPGGRGEGRGKGEGGGLTRERVWREEGGARRGGGRTRRVGDHVPHESLDVRPLLLRAGSLSELGTRSSLQGDSPSPAHAPAPAGARLGHEVVEAPIELLDVLVGHVVRIVHIIPRVLRVGPELRVLLILQRRQSGLRLARRHLGARREAGAAR